MAVNFQRRNIGVLADTPTFEDVGRGSYVDYAAAGARAPTSGVMPAAVKSAEVQKTPALAGPQTPEVMAEYEAAQLEALKQAEEAALRQRNSVKNPLNVVGNAISAVVGTPFRLLENAIGGGNNDLAAPFRPNQTAQDRYQSKLADISTAKLGLMQTMDGMRANQAQAITNALTNEGERVQSVQNQLAIAANNANILKRQGKDPYMAFERTKNFLMANPVSRTVMQQLGYDEMPWYDGLAAELAQNKDTLTRFDESGKVTTTVLPYQSTAIQTDQYGGRVGIIQQDGSLTAPVVSPNPTAPTELPTFTEDDWNNAGGTSGNAGGTFR
jgi:hypothetical protein